MIVSPLPLAVIVVSAVPVVMLMPLSLVLLPVVTVKLPVRPVALISPTKPVTTCFAVPLSVNVVLFARLLALMVRVSSLLLALTVVAALPVVMLAVLSLTSEYARFTVPVLPAASVLASRLLTV